MYIKSMREKHHDRQQEQGKLWPKILFRFKEDRRKRIASWGLDSDRRFIRVLPLLSFFFSELLSFFWYDDPFFAIPLFSGDSRRHLDSFLLRPLNPLRPKPTIKRSSKIDPWLAILFCDPRWTPKRSLFCDPFRSPNPADRNDPKRSILQGSPRRSPNSDPKDQCLASARTPWKRSSKNDPSPTTRSYKAIPKDPQDSISQGDRHRAPTRSTIREAILSFFL